MRNGPCTTFGCTCTAFFVLAILYYLSDYKSDYFDLVNTSFLPIIRVSIFEIEMRLRSGVVFEDDTIQLYHSFYILSSVNC